MGREGEREREATVRYPLFPPVMTPLFRPSKKFQMATSLHCAFGVPFIVVVLATFLNFRVGRSFGRSFGRLNRTNEISSCVNDDKMWLTPLPSPSPSPVASRRRPSEGGRVGDRGSCRGCGHCHWTHKTLSLRPRSLSPRGDDLCLPTISYYFSPSL